MAKLTKLLAMNLATFSNVPRSVYSLGANRLHGLQSQNNRLGFCQTQICSVARLVSKDLLTAPPPSAAAASPAYQNIYILRFGSQIHKYSKDTGIGIFIYDAANGKKIWAARRFIPVASSGEKITNNIADYMALVDGLKAMKVLQNTQTLTSPCRIEVQTSNRVVAKHLSKEFKVGTKSLQPWYETVTKLMNSFYDMSAGQIPSLDCGDVRKASELAIKEQKSCENYLEVVAGTKAEVPDALEDSNESEEASMPQNQSEMASISQNHSEGANIPLNQPHASSTSEISSDKVYILRFDGGSRGNPGIAGSGMALYDSQDGSEIWSGCLYLGDQRTNNEAEYMGLITGMKCALSLGVKQIVVQGDSKLVLEQIALRWKVKSPSLKHYFDEAIELKKQFAYFETSHIERAKNSRADELANEAMDTRCSRGFKS
ncbi:hypothetical protein ACHAWO_010450 [Cyclotella atomus]|uniref:RNase H type-1 domain-containing protein n=1 Tax=Cyclotella atomus TaxID=382360 RepID=A0ABD3MRR8_9STRA